jgi:nucleoside-diphosphate-sugar epimerase
MRVLITGGTGFIGSRLALRCLQRGDSVTLLGQVNNSAEKENQRVLEDRGAKVILVSVADRDGVFEAIEGIECVFHLAAAQHEANVPDQHFWNVNVTGTKNVLEGSMRAGVKIFVHGSTIGVYGDALDGRIDEASPLQPNNIYGVTKLEAEKLVLSFQQKMPVVIIRISETYGPGDYRLLKLFKAIKKGVFFVIGSGKNLHHLIHVDDLIEGLFLAATVEAAHGKAFVLAGKDVLTTREMAEIVAGQLGEKLPRLQIPLFPFLLLASILEGVLRPLGIQPPLHKRRMDFFKKSFLFSQEQSTAVLGFVPKIAFSEGVADTAKWYEEMGYL